MPNFRTRLTVFALFCVVGLGLNTYLGSDSADPSEGNATVQYHQALGKEFSRGPGDLRPPKVPNPHFFNQRAFPLGEIPLERWQIALTEAADLRSQSRGSSSAWEFRGPTNIGGRITCLAISPLDPNRVFAGTAEGGVLRTTDGGTLWVPIFDDQSVLSIGALTLDPSDPDIIYVGTGEVNPGGGSVAYGGQGMFRSTDGGDSWVSIGLEQSGSIGRIRVDPTDPDRIFVGAMGTLWSRSETRGVYRTTNGGDSWERVLFVADDTGCVDLIQRPDDPDVLYAAMWERLRQPEAYDYAGANCAIHRTTDGGETWALVGGGLPAPSNNIGRIGLTLCESSPDVLYSVYTAGNGFFAGLYKSTDGGFNWTRTSDGSLAGVFASYGWWFGNLRVHPLDPDIVFVFGLDFYRTQNGGNSYSSVGGSMHVDHHALAFGPGANPVIFAGNDGGIYRSSNGGSGWNFVGNQPITQLYRVALDPGAPDAILGGAQDNGTMKTDGAENGYFSLFGGDGLGPLVHPNDSDKIWAQYQYGNLFYSPNGGAGWSSALGGVGSDRKNWNSPIAQDPLNPGIRYWGTHRVYRSASTTSWTPISADLTGGTHQGNNGQVDGTLTTIGVSPVDNDVIWSGSDDGYVYVTSTGGDSWSRVDAALPERWITSVRPDPFSASAALVTLSGYRWGEALPRIYRTTNLGATWISVAGNLPDAPVNDVFIDPENASHYVVATDVGAFQTFDEGTNWSTIGTGLPPVVVTDLEFAPASRTLVAATFGRGFYSIDLELPADVADAPAGAGPSWLHAPSPHPITDGTFLRWDARSSEVTLRIFSSSGRQIWSSRVPGSPGRIWWDRTSSRGERAAAGIYYVRARSMAGDGRESPEQTRTLVLR